MKASNSSLTDGSQISAFIKNLDQDSKSFVASRVPSSIFQFYDLDSVSPFRRIGNRQNLQVAH